MVYVPGGAVGEAQRYGKLREDLVAWGMRYFAAQSAIDEQMLVRALNSGVDSVVVLSGGSYQTDDGWAHSYENDARVGWATDVIVILDQIEQLVLVGCPEQRDHMTKGVDDLDPVWIEDLPLGQANTKTQMERLQEAGYGDKLIVTSAYHVARAYLTASCLFNSQPLVVGVPWDIDRPYDPWEEWLAEVDRILRYSAGEDPDVATPHHLPDLAKFFEASERD